VKTKARLKLEKAKSKSTSTFHDPIRLYDRPIYFDVWFLVGLILTVPDILTAILITIKADFQWDVADSSISGFAFLLGQTIVLFGLGSVLPVFIRRSMRRGKLKAAPMRTEPGFYQDPIRKNSQRYWDGTSWTAELRAPYKREVARTVVLCTTFFALSLLLALGPAVKGLATQTLMHAYGQSTGLAQQIALSEPLSADYALYATAYADVAEAFQALAQEIQACASAQSACARGAVEAADEQLVSAIQALPVVAAPEPAQ